MSPRPTPAQVPVICIDGPTASGKGTLAAAVADALGYHLLDSGALYRATGLASLVGRHRGRRRSRPGAPGRRCWTCASAMAPRASRAWLRGREVSDELRSEAAGLLASRISALPAVRHALQDLQLAFRRAPGLVADGRDMGTVIFPAAPLKVYLTASAATRAQDAISS